MDDFFKLNEGYIKILNDSDFDSRIHTSKHLCNLAYMPDELSNKKIEGLTFEQFSFSKTLLKKVTFKNCIFKNCLFIGSVIEECNIHSCEFIDCNFFRCKIKKTYAKPQQFKKVISKSEYANVAVSLFNELRNQYKEDSQREFKSEAEYYFSKWNRIEAVNTAKRERNNWITYTPSRVSSYLHYLFFGFGYRLRNLIGTTIVALFIMIFVNYKYSPEIFIESPENMSVIKSAYFTITTMATLGASGFSEFTELGYLVVIANVLVGISLLTFTANSVLKRVVR
ncbi:ion channel [Vibrio casei]|uniref:ion channel n=1 Tax=Vibrio casei TaxID=673372 RepID=UPI003F98E390